MEPVKNNSSAASLSNIPNVSHTALNTLHISRIFLLWILVKLTSTVSIYHAATWKSCRLEISPTKQFSWLVLWFSLTQNFRSNEWSQTLPSLFCTKTSWAQPALSTWFGLPHSHQHGPLDYAYSILGLLWLVAPNSSHILTNLSFKSVICLVRFTTAMDPCLGTSFLYYLLWCLWPNIWEEATLWRKDLFGLMV